MNIDLIQAADELLIFNTTQKPIPIPYHLKKTLEAESCNIGHNDNKILILAVHSVFLESGFVCFDEDLIKLVEGFSLPVGWATNLHSVKLTYTLTYLTSFETVTVLFLTDQDDFIIHGSLDNIFSRIHHAIFSISRFVPAMDLVLETSDALRIGTEMELNESYPDREVYTFWSKVKAELMRFLKIDICLAGGLNPPACLGALPSELKMVIVEKLPARDIGRLRCCCREFTEAFAAEELWRNKCFEDFESMVLSYSELKLAREAELQFQALYGGGDDDEFQKVGQEDDNMEVDEED